MESSFFLPPHTFIHLWYSKNNMTIGKALTSAWIYEQFTLYTMRKWTGLLDQNDIFLDQYICAQIICFSSFHKKDVILFLSCLMRQFKQMLLPMQPRQYEGQFLLSIADCIVHFSENQTQP